MISAKSHAPSALHGVSPLSCRAMQSYLSKSWPVSRCLGGPTTGEDKANEKHESNLRAFCQSQQSACSEASEIEKITQQ
jgi:hypothetical protein